MFVVAGERKLSGYGASRQERLFGSPPEPFGRSPFAADRDAFYYLPAFRRLAGVTQVVSAPADYLLHNRLTHTLAVAQIGRRLAENLTLREGDLAKDLGGIDPDVVEAAALAHDIGHPPFGHAAEEALDSALRESGIPDGFEGNAQSFRLVNKLVWSSFDHPGMNLTRATLDAILKYPSLRRPGERKFGAYLTERVEFEFARALHTNDEQRSVEAELMDWADDMSYAVHDLEDFSRAGLIPLQALARGEGLDEFVGSVVERWRRNTVPPPYSPDDFAQTAQGLLDLLAMRAGAGTVQEHASWRARRAMLQSRFAQAIHLVEPRGAATRRVTIDEHALREIAVLKELTRTYAIERQALTEHQSGVRRIVRDLLLIYQDAIESGRTLLLPVEFRQQLKLADEAAETETDRVFSRARLATDVICGLTDRGALELHQRLTGIAPGSGL